MENSLVAQTYRNVLIEKNFFDKSFLRIFNYFKNPLSRRFQLAYTLVGNVSKGLCTIFNRNLWLKCLVYNELVRNFASLFRPKYTYILL